MRYLFAIVRAYPWQSALMVAALLFAGILEGVGLSMILPLLSLAMNNPTRGAGLSGTTNATPDSELARFVSDAFKTIGLHPTLEAMLVVIIVTIVLKSIIMLLAKKQVGYTVARVATDLRLALLRALLKARWQYYLSQPVGKFANAMATESGRSAKGFQHGVIMVSDFIQAIAVGCVAVMVSWKTTLIALVIGLIIIFILKRFVKKARKAGNRQTTLMKSLLALMTDMLQSIKPLKAMARESVADFLLENKTQRLNKVFRKRVFNQEALKAFQEPLLIIFMATGLYAALVYWHLPLSTLMVLAYLLARFIKQLNKVQERYQQMAVFESAYWSMQDSIQKAQQEPEPTQGSKTPTLQKAIRFERVGFAYSDKWVLQNASLSFPVGKITAVVGPSGSGKTTIMDLLTGLLQPQEGEIWIDELPLTQVNLKRWRRMIGYIPQEAILLHDTIRNNISLGDTSLEEHDIIEALRSADALDFVNSLPEGINTLVGERGGKFSGGQRQRIVIARALVHRPKLLILDEATSALDPETEAAICETLSQMRGNLTILVISHQPALVKIADRAYRIQDGIISENERTN